MISIGERQVSRWGPDVLDDGSQILRLTADKPAPAARLKTRAYWSRFVNFGDQLTPALLSNLGLTPCLAKPEDSEVVAAGSVLGRVPHGYRGILFGCGFIAANEFGRHPDAIVLSLRGPLTRERFYGPEPYCLGDSGLLTPWMLREPIMKKWALGLVPHFVDKGDGRIQRLKMLERMHVTIIDVQRSPIEVIQNIAECEAILSSSLHGLVVADAFGIPNRWMVLSDRVIGHGFKFLDYFATYGERHTPVELVELDRLRSAIDACIVPPPRIRETQDRMFTAWRTLGQLLGASREPVSLRKSNCQS